MSYCRILVVAGDGARRGAWEHALRAAGWTDVVVADSAAGAVREIRSGPVGCAVVAAELADVSGLRSIPILRAVDPQLRIVFAAPSDDAALETQVRALDVFYYHLEADGDEDLVAAVSAAVGRPRSGGTRGAARVLIVDDDRYFRDSLRLVLEHSGYRVTTAGNSTAALELAKTKRPDLIVLDIMLDSATEGLQLVHELRRDPELRYTPLIAVSAVGRPEALAVGWRDDGELSRTDRFFQKPVDPTEFLAAVRTLLGKGG